MQSIFTFILLELKAHIGYVISPPQLLKTVQRGKVSKSFEQPFKQDDFAITLNLCELFML